MGTLDEILSSREPVAETTQETTQAAPETTQEAEVSTEQTTDETAPADGKAPPIGAIRQAEREKATKRYTEQVADFDRRLSEQNTAWERRFTQLLDAVKQPPQQQQPPDFFENPEAGVLRAVAPHLQQVNQRQALIVEELARTRYGDEVVDEAAQAYEQLRANGQLDPADYHKISNSQNPYSAVVQWHKKRQASLEIGDDPAAYREKVKAELLAELQQQNGNGAAQQQAAPVMPSNLATARNVGSRAGPAWAGPMPLNDIFSRGRAK
jgi:hypothetical protein